ncbi:MAG: type II secretion system F family protein [Candidatus Eisenbacteria bacterium]|nr:type II secretion system F family protein [Candidatus Eisenbacteria bacterium]
MGNFAYVVKSRSGEERSGFTAGSSVDEVVSHLHSQGYVVLHVTEDRSQDRGLPWHQRLSSMHLGRVSTRELALFTRQLSTVLQAGIPLVRGLRGLAADAGSKMLAMAVADIANRIERGESLSDGMVAHPEAFNRMYVSMIRAGERAGTLDEILEDLAVYLEKIDAIKTKVRSALSYPLFVLVFAIGATAFLLFKIVPTFAEIYADLGQNLPGLTQAVVAASNAVRHNVLLSAVITIGVILFFYLWTRTRSGRYAMDTFLIRMPIFGPIIRKAIMSRFARTFGMLLRSGLPILDALELVKGASGNSVVAHAIDDAKGNVGAGHGITSSFRATGKFPEMVLQLMATGEETGDMDTMLLKVSDFYDRQVEASVHSLTSLIEPLMIVVVGGLIGVIVVSMFLPIFYLGDAIMKGGYNF